MKHTLYKSSENYDRLTKGVCLSVQVKLVVTSKKKIERGHHKEFDFFGFLDFLIVRQVNNKNITIKIILQNLFL